MNFPTHDTIRQLLLSSAQTYVSLYMPAHPASAPAIREDVIRYKNLLGQAKTQLDAEAMATMKSSLRQADKLLSDQKFWQSQSQGLAVFISPDRFETYRLPVAADEAVYVGDRFYINPLLESIDRQHTLYMLALSQGSARLLKGQGAEVHEVSVAGMPLSLADATKHLEQEKLLSNRSGAGPAGNFHGEGDDTREPHPLMREYLLQVDNALTNYLKHKTEPLVVLALEPALGLFCKLTHHPNVVGRVEINPGSLHAAQLHDKAWTAAMKAFPHPIEAAQNAYGHYAATEPNRTETDPARIAEAARQGRVETLMVASSASPREAMAFGERLPMTSPKPSPPSRELEAAIQETYLTGGAVWAVPADQMPSGTELAAIMRY